MRLNILVWHSCKHDPQPVGVHSRQVPQYESEKNAQSSNSNPPILHTNKFLLLPPPTNSNPWNSHHLNRDLDINKDIDNSTYDNNNRLKVRSIFPLNTFSKLSESQLTNLNRLLPPTISKTNLRSQIQQHSLTPSHEPDLQPRIWINSLWICNRVGMSWALRVEIRLSL